MMDTNKYKTYEYSTDDSETGSWCTVYELDTALRAIKVRNMDDMDRIRRLEEENRRLKEENYKGDTDVKEEYYVASCSWGKDSTAMVLKLIEENYPLDEVIFYDTGMEFNSIYSVRDQILPILNNNNIKYTELHPSRPFWTDMLIRQKKKRDGRIVYGDEWCGGACRWQTFIKQRICNQYTKGCIVYIGLAKDEEKRLANVEEYKRTPLVDFNMTEKDCLQYCHDVGVFWYEDGVELYSILDRVSCWCCRNKNLKELKNIYLYLPKYWSMLKGLQSRIDEPFKGEGKSIFELEERFKDEINS